MVKYPYLKSVFPKPPMIAYKRPKSLKDILIKAKIPPFISRWPKRQTSGMKRCLKCCICPYVHCTNFIKSSSSDDFLLNVKSSYDCRTSNVIYLIECLKCKKQYVGQTSRSLKERIKEHLGYIRNSKISEPTGSHFNLPGHDISMLQVSILEKCKLESKVYRETREEFFIQKFQTKFKGMNRKF